MRAWLELVAPTTCAGCSAPAEGDLCMSCADSVVVVEGACARCGGPDPRPACACSGLRGFGRAASLVAFAEPARSLTLRLKRRAPASCARGMGMLLAALAEREGLVPDAVTYVPAPRGSLRRRPDHAGLLASAVGLELGVPVRRLLRRAHAGPRQADVPLAERRTNVAGRFTARRATGRILLVDDVYTTGATAEACSLALLAAGAGGVDVLTWARTLLRRRVTGASAPV